LLHVASCALELLQQATRGAQHAKTMFTGIIEKTAKVIGVADGPKFRRLTLALRATDVKNGESIALVSDAGTPTVSDPGHRFIAAAIEAGIRVEPVPGPSAALAALAASGLPTDTFLFLGFPPIKAKDRLRWFEEVRLAARTVVFFEAPHRLIASLEDAAAVLRPRSLVVCRELTKIHEEFVRTSTTAAPDVFRSSKVIGEYTLLFGPPVDVEPDSDPLGDDVIWAEIGRLTEEGKSRREAVAELAGREGRSSKDIYAAAERGKRLATSE